MPSSLSRTHAQRRAAQRLAHLGRSVQRRAAGDSLPRPARPPRPPADALPPRPAAMLGPLDQANLPMLPELPELQSPVWPSVGANQ